MEIFSITHLPQNNTTGMEEVHLQYHQCHLEQFFCPLTGECEPIFTQSYINAYNTAFNQPVNSQIALYEYYEFYPTSQYINSNFVPGTFGYDEGYNNQSNPSNNITINYLQDDLNVYSGTPYLFVSTGSGGGSGFMYLDWIIVTYGVPYVVSVS